MSKVCSNCGATLEDSAAFCANCGAQSAVEAAPAAPKSKKPLWIAVVAGVVAAIVAAVVLLIVLGDSYKTPINRAIDITFYGNFEDLGDYAPDAYWDNATDTRENAIEALKEQGAEYLEEMFAEMKEIFGENYEVDYEINDKNSLSDGKLNVIGKALEETYGIDPDDVDGGYKLNITISVNGSKENAETTAVVTCLEIDGDWYMISHSGSNVSFVPVFEDALEDLIAQVSDGDTDEF